MYLNSDSSWNENGHRKPSHILRTLKTLTWSFFSKPLSSRQTVDGSSFRLLDKKGLQRLKWCCSFKREWQTEWTYEKTSLHWIESLLSEWQNNPQVLTVIRAGSFHSRCQETKPDDAKWLFVSRRVDQHTGIKRTSYTRTQSWQQQLKKRCDSYSELYVHNCWSSTDKIYEKGTKCVENSIAQN